jgi:hypothetical protein
MLFLRCRREGVGSYGVMLRRLQFHVSVRRAPFPSRRITARIIDIAPPRISDGQDLARC